MPAVKKFGTFNGVFTPAILTILGVIMYLRLPWIVGQAGLYTTIGIILVAHIISITTGLSVSSIATDKRVKTGGTYYMISRSLGLPIGGTLGLALFIGLSFSVSLYLIGFSESFLGFWGVAVSKNAIRVVGTSALLGVTIITFISTSLALKTQFFILIAIILSLISIFLGENPRNVAHPLLMPVAGSAPFIVLFGIFFPAVTGFEAGVSMSGDLQNPKKSIPLGTIIAIAVGLFAYLGMAIFFAFRVTSDQLVNNANVLLEISFFPPLVLAGIWGATLSSAMGSILGAPRILQAISIDKITPRFFGVGYGKENEPRNALLLTFALAEAGILVGELDVIARVVSMFFITTYGFLNMSCAIENWASPDFRPEFQIPKFISIIGSVTCVIVMIQLDLAAMFGAILILSLLFFHLKRKELTLESGDTWEGVWSSVIRSGLEFLNKGKVQQRNWRPNIILFSGNISARPHLLKLGKHLVYKRGILSSFDLIEVEGTKQLFRKTEQAVNADDEATRGIFSRRVECNDIYSTIETISKYYGFSGIEPNTILMGWGADSQRPDKFAHMIHTLWNLDYNLMLLSYDEERGFGTHQQIDVWWRGNGNTISFAASLCRFLTGSDEWRQAQIRFLLITDHSSLTERLHLIMNQIIEDFRIEAMVKVINNAVEQKPFYEIIQRESKDADLIINGISEIQPGEESLYVSKTNAIIENLGTILLIRASSFFKDSFEGLYSSPPLDSALSGIDTKPTATIPPRKTVPIDLPTDCAMRVSQLSDLLSATDRHVEQEFLAELQQLVESPVSRFQSILLSNIEIIRKQFPNNERIKNRRLISRILGDVLFQLQKALADHLAESESFKSESLAESIIWVKARVDSISKDLPERITIPRNDSQLQPAAGDSLTIRLSKRLKRITKRFFKHPAMSTVRYRALASSYLQTLYWEKWLEFYNNYVTHSLQSYPEVQRAIDKIVDSLGGIYQQLKADLEISPEEVLLELDEDEKIGETLVAANHTRWQHAALNLRSANERVVAELTSDLSQFDSHHRLLPHRHIRKKAERLLEKLQDIPATWTTNHRVMMKTVMADLTILSMKHRVSTMIGRAKSEIWTNIENQIVLELDYLVTLLEDLKTGDISIEEFKASTTTSFKKSTTVLESWSRLDNELHKIINDLPESMDVVQQETAQASPDPIIQPWQALVIDLRRRAEFFFESIFLGPLDDEINQIATQFEKIVTNSLDVIRLLPVGLSEAERENFDPGKDDSGSRELIVRDSLTRIVDLKRKALETQVEIDSIIDENLRNTMASINLFSLAESQKSNVQLTSASRKHWLRQQLSHKKQWLVSEIGSISTNLLYRRSSSGTYHEKTGLVPQGPESSVEQLLSFVESISPRPESLTTLPFYYKHLFLGKPLISRDFWVGRSAELQRAAKAISRFRNGIPGGLAIVGHPGSGKTALSRMIAARSFEKQKTWYLTPPESNCADPALFESRLKETLEMTAEESIHQFQWPQNSVLIIDDIGSWWQRMDNGYRVIAQITDLIKTIGDRCLVIINANTASFRFLDEVLGLNPHLQDIIVCEPFDIKSLKEIVMVRHRSTGLRFHVNQISEDELSRWAIARLFTRSFSDCSGNVGLALKKWIRCIDSITKERFDLILPEKPNLKKLSSLNSDQLLIITQLLLHTRLTHTTLATVMKTDRHRLEIDLKSLLTAGILTVSRSDVIELNLFAINYLFQYFIQKGIDMIELYSTVTESYRIVFWGWALGILIILGVLRKVATESQRRPKFNQIIHRLLPLADAMGVVILLLLLGKAVFQNQPAYQIGFLVIVVAFVLWLIRLPLLDTATGIVLRFENAFAPGNPIDLGDHKGTIAKVGMRCLSIRLEKGKTVLIPYSQLSQKSLATSHSTRLVKSGSFDLDLPKSTAIAQIESQLKQDIMNQPWSIVGLKPIIEPKTTHSNQLRFAVTVYALELEHLSELEHAIRLKYPGTS